ncbi:FapA family protein [Ruminococcaceae bacterium OttesenSCG-928-I18]|nr:FapA family protein [Ruminococcaceae bacterium OttesenSCG-928-I18]
MSDLSNIFPPDAKVVISPDEMRAWIMLPPAPQGVKYTLEAVQQWLPQNGVVYGAREDMINKALASGKTYELLEVARGDEPQAPEGGSYEMRVEVKPFTGLAANSDGSLIYDDLSFLQPVPEGQVLAEIVPAKPGVAGKSVTGNAVAPKEGKPDVVLKGKGFVVSEDGRRYVAPVASHLSMVSEELVATPYIQRESLKPEDGPLRFNGNIVIEKDVHAGAVIEASGSVFVGGRCENAKIKAGRNILLGGGMYSSGEIGQVEAKENLWGMMFESVNLKAGGDLCANHLMGCEASAEGRALITGGRGMIVNTSLYARGGVVCQQLGDESGSKTTVSVGMGAELIERFESVEKRMVKLTQDIQNLLQSITAFEKINRNKPDRGKNTNEYRELVAKKDQALSVLNITEGERARLKRTMDSFSVVSIIVKDRVFPGVVVRIDTRLYEVDRPMQKLKFRRSGEVVELVSSTQDR